ncbi:MAG: AMP-binding protein [Holophagales bacterium]|nr:AMP-binding protein [Holophagales bacterium]
MSEASPGEDIRGPSAMISRGRGGSEAVSAQPETIRPENAEPETRETFNSLVLDALDRHGSDTVFRTWRGGRYRDVSYRYFRRQTLRTTRFLCSKGIYGERVALWAPSTPEWMVVYLATLFAGGVAVPLRRSLPRQTIEAMLRDCGAKVAFVDGETELAWLAELRSGPSGLELILTTESPDPPLEGAVTLAEVVSERLDAEVVEALRHDALAVPAESLATLTYTTTQAGEPMAAVFDQGQRRKTVENAGGWMRFVVDDLAFTALPWAYPASLDVGLCYLVSGVPNVLSHGRELVFEEIQQASPTLVLTIPNALERAYDELIDASIRRLPDSTQEMFYWALATGKQLLQAGAEASPELRERYSRADRTFFSAIRGAFGGRFRRFYCTGAPLHRTLAESIRAIGLVPINSYSLTEAGGFPAVNRADARHADACGPAAPGFELDLADDGEVLVRGETVMREYWRRPDATERAFTADGRLRTGDYGRFDEEGHLHLTGRVGASLLLSTGRRVDPAYLERLLCESPYVHLAAVVGEARPYVAAVLVPELDVLMAHLREQAEGDEPIAPSDPRAASATSLRWYWQSGDDERQTLVTAAHPWVEEMLAEVVAGVNALLDESERIERFCLLGQAHSEEAHRLGDLIAHDRGAIPQELVEQLEAMYPRGLQDSDREITQVQVGPERLRELLEKEAILDAWTTDAGIGFLLDLAREHDIETPSVVHICDVAASVAQMEAEEKPLSTALVVGDPMRIHRVLSSSLIQLHRHEHIRRLRGRVVDLAKLVDGLVLAYVVDRHGYVRGICRLEIEVEEEPKALLGPQFRLHAEVSRRSDAVVFFVPKGGRQVRVFARGELVGRYSNGDWSPENAAGLTGDLDQLTAKRQIAPELMAQVLRCAFRMSETNLGAIFLIGDADRILQKSDAPEISHFAWISSAPMASLTDEELIAFAKQDGATVIDAATGRFRSCMVLLRPDAATRAEVGPGKGARHSSAAKMSAEAQALAVTVSQDGPITVYDRGRRMLAL